MRILITGKNGQVGTEFSRLYHSSLAMWLWSVERNAISAASILSATWFGGVEPAVVIINAGAYTAVDQGRK